MRQELFDGLHVWWLPIGLLIAVLSAWWSSRRQHTSWSGVPKGLPRSWRQRTRWLPRCLGWLALLLLLFGLTGPRGVREHREVTGEGLAITLCIDRSGSMLALDLADSVVRRSRLDVVKDVVDRFVRGDTTMAGRRGDLLSIVQFGTHADEVTPPTFDHEYVAEAVEGLEVSALESERATAIGDALGLAVERLDALRSQDLNQTIGDQIIILLTDGEQRGGAVAAGSRRVGSSLGCSGVHHRGGDDFRHRPHSHDRSFHGAGTDSEHAGVSGYGDFESHCGTNWRPSVSGHRPELSGGDLCRD